MMRKPITLLGLLFLFVFIFSLTLTTAGKVQAGPIMPGCCAVFCQGEWNYGHEVYMPGGEIFCSCIDDHRGCTHYCGSCAQ